MLMSQSVRALHFAARPAVVAHYFGRVLLVLGALTAVPAAVAFADGEAGVAARFAVVTILLLALAGLARRLPAITTIQRNEALIVSALAFVVPPFLLAVPLMGFGLTFQDAFFEAVSGVTTTGLSVVPDVDAMPFAFHFARAWLQWLGGLGVVVLCVAFLIEPGIAAKYLGVEAPDAGDMGGTRAYARRALIAYMALTAAGIVLLLAVGMDPGSAVVHALAAISTGGFSDHTDSLAAFTGAGVRFGVIAICFAGAIPFHLYTVRNLRDWRPWREDVQLRGLILATGAVALVLFAVMWASHAVDVGTALERAVLTAVSAETTAGFSVVPYAALDNAARGVVIAAMIVGGGFGSTAGGIKILRLLIMLRFMQLMIVRCSVPASSHISTRLGGRMLHYREIEAAMAVVFGYGAVLFVSWLVFLAYGFDPLAALFEVSSAIGTVGLTSGVSSHDLAAPLKALLCFDMLIGRVEILALVVLLFPPSWIGRRRMTP